MALQWSLAVHEPTQPMQALAAPLTMQTSTPSRFSMTSQ
jgi:hypothetical protein